MRPFFSVSFFVFLLSIDVVFLLSNLSSTYSVFTLDFDKIWNIFVIFIYFCYIYVFVILIFEKKRINIFVECLILRHVVKEIAGNLIA